MRVWWEIHVLGMYAVVCHECCGVSHTHTHTGKHTHTHTGAELGMHVWWEAHVCCVYAALDHSSHLAAIVRCSPVAVYSMTAKSLGKGVAGAHCPSHVTR